MAAGAGGGGGGEGEEGSGRHEEEDGVRMVTCTAASTLAEVGVGRTGMEREGGFALEEHPVARIAVVAA